MNKRSFIKIGSMVLVIVILLLLVVVDKFNENEITAYKTSPKVSIGTGEGYENWSYGAWEISTYLTSDSSNITIDNGTSLTLNSSNGSIEDDEVVFHLTAEMENNTAYSDLEEDSLVFYLPLYLYYGKNSYSYVLDESNNSLHIYNSSSSNEVGYISFGSDLPYCDYLSYDDDVYAACFEIDEDFFWSYDEFNIYIVNSSSILADNGDNNFNFNIDIAYGFSGDEIDSSNEFEFYGVVSFNFDEYISLATMTSRLIADDDTEEIFDISDIASEEEVVYESWQSEWGEQTEDYDIYSMYAISGNVNYSSEYELSVIPDVGDGTIVASSSDGNNYSTSNDGNYCEVSATGNTDYICYIIVGYNLNGKTSLAINFGLTVYGTTDTEELSSIFEWNFVYEKNDESISYPSGVSKDFNVTLVDDDAGVGAINRLENESDLEFNWLIESGVSSINNTNSGVVKAFNLWNLTDNGLDDYTISLGNIQAVIDSSYTNNVNPYNLDSSDYVIESFYIQDDVEYDYVLDGDSYILDESDISDYSNKEVYIKIDDGDYELIGTYVKDESGNIVYTASNSYTSSVSDVNEDNQVILPSNTTDIKVVYSGSKAAIYVGLNIKTKLISSDNVKSIINNLSDSDIVLKNYIDLNINDENTSNFAATYLTELETNSYLESYSSVGERSLNSDGNIEDVITYTDNIYEQIIFNDDTKNSAYSILQEQSNGIIYELLPKGASLSGDVLVRTYNGEAECEVTVTNTANYNGTGRNLLKVVIGDCDGTNYYENSNVLQTGYTIIFDIKYDSIANQSYGNSLVKDTMFESNTILSDAYSTASDASSLLFSDSSVITLFDSIIGTNNKCKYLFGTNSTLVDEITVTSSSYYKNVSEDGIDYDKEISVVEGKYYKYRLQYTFASDYDEITNLIFVDKIEDVYDGDGYFKGYFVNVDTSYLNNEGVSTVVYYTTLDSITLDEIDLSDSSVWSTTKPSDVSEITAIAVSCGDYIFKASEGIVPMIDINMQASNSYVSGGSKAYNNSTILYSYYGSSVVKKIKSDNTIVNLEKASVEISATSSFGNGSINDPAIITSNYSYYVSINNYSNEDEYDNLEVEVYIPEGLNIVDVFDSSSNESVDYNFDDEKRILTYSISSLEAMETKAIEIKVNVDLENDNIDEDLIATFKLSKLADNEYDGDTIYVYNKLELPSLSYNKYVKTTDSGEFTDEAMVLIDKGEVYTYRISITNTSDVDAYNINVTDSIADGLSVVEDSINYDGYFDSVNKQVVWDIDTLEANSTIYLEYDVAVDSDIQLGTVYRSSGHISLINPIDNSLMLYDDDTNIISTIYQVMSDVKVTNNLVGNLASSTKKFSYTIEFNGDESHAGEYNVVNSSGEIIDTLNIDSDGIGNYEASLANGESITFENLLGNIDYEVMQNEEDGYDTTTNIESSYKNGFIIVNGTITDTNDINIIYTNSYDVKTSVNIDAKVTYDKEISDGMFTLLIDDSNGYTQEKDIDSNGFVNFDEIIYSNIVGTFTYIVSQTNMNLAKVGYDLTSYKVVVNVVDDGVGNLSASVKYYNKNDEEVDSLVFNNEYVPNGLIINNVNSSDYVNTDKEFNYKLIVNSEAGSYVVKNSDGDQLDDLVVLDTGIGEYSFVLKSDEKITIYDLPNGSSYTIEQEIEDYYSVVVDGFSYSVDNDVISTSGIIGDETIQVIFDNNYSTSAVYSFSANISLENKELDDGEFTFIMKDVSSGSTNGTVLYASNDSEGIISFDNINYIRPGTYTYEISQIEGSSNHIYYDLSKCILTVVLVDNGDGTMSLESSTYSYENGLDSFVNSYSEEPIVVENDNVIVNPNTNDRLIIISVLLGIVFILFIIESRLKARRYKMNI